MSILPALTLSLITQWQAVEGVSLLPGTGGYITFGDRTELNSAEHLAILISVSRESTGWFSSTRNLVSRNASGKRQLAVLVNPLGGLGAISVGFSATPSGSLVYRYVPDTSTVFQGKTPMTILVCFDQGQVRAWVDGREAQLTGSGALPTALTTVSGIDLRLGSTDQLRANVSNFAVWVGSTPCNDAIKARSTWCQGGVCDLSAGTVRGHDGSAVSIPAPMWWWPLSGDTLPDIAPRIGAIGGAIIGGSGAKTQYYPKSAARPDDPFDLAADYRFEIVNGVNDGLVGTYASSPAILLDGGVLWIARSRGTAHLAPNQHAVLERSYDLGLTWPQRERPWPSLPQNALEVAYETVDSVRASSICKIPGGRILHFVTRRIMDLSQPVYRFFEVRHTDDSGASWSAWRNVATLGTRFTSQSGAQKCVIRSDGGVSVAAYHRDWIEGAVPPEEAPYYTASVVTSWDSGFTWQQTGIIADGEGPPTAFWEEPVIGELSGGEWLALLRKDYPAPPGPGTYSALSTDGGVTWSEPLFAFPGANTPTWIERPDGRLLALSRALDTGHALLWWSENGGASWVGGLDLTRPGSNAALNVGYAFAELPDGRIGIVMAHERPSTPTLLEWIRLRPGW